MKPVSTTLLLLLWMGGAVAQTKAAAPSWAELENWARVGPPQRARFLSIATPAAGGELPTWNEVEQWAPDAPPATNTWTPQLPTSTAAIELIPTRNEVFRLVFREACFAGVSPDLALSIADTESGFVSTAVSNKGAKGAMQIMPSTARAYAGNGAEDRLFEAEFNVKLGVRILADLQDRYPRPATVAACYYAGEGFPEIRKPLTQEDVLRYTRIVVRKMETRYRGYSCLALMTQ
ncbi:MAG: transglycosylase SLT domain-containing protein [Acidobacteriia bacterium]|nr:transglycosylase SLT domain-containing protein [Terriglobia bacterium]